jgi:hypothetical protein
MKKYLLIMTLATSWLVASAMPATSFANTPSPSYPGPYVTSSCDAPGGEYAGIGCPDGQDYFNDGSTMDCHTAVSVCTLTPAQQNANYTAGFSCDTGCYASPPYVPSAAACPQIQMDDGSISQVVGIAFSNKLIQLVQCSLNAAGSTIQTFLAGFSVGSDGSVTTPSLTVGATPTTNPTSGTVYATNVSFGTNGANGTLTGAYGKYVGSTASKNGNIGGYATATALCNSKVSGSHVCTAKEIINSYELGVSLPTTNNNWINNGPPGYSDTLTNDCNAWTNSGSVTIGGSSITVYGSIWNFKKGYSAISGCNASLPVACCSY